MRDIDECAAEVFCRSEKRIKEIKKKRKRAFNLCATICLCFVVLSLAFLPLMLPMGGHGALENDVISEIEYISTNENDALENYGSHSGEYTNPVFSFAITWNTYGTSSYDSATGKLVKSTDATVPDDYITTLYLDETQLLKIWELFSKLDIDTYPDEYDPYYETVYSEPSETLILTLRYGDHVKTVRAEGVAIAETPDNAKGQNFLYTCQAICDILTATDEWKSLPEYESFYD